MATPKLNIARMTGAKTAITDVLIDVPPIPTLEVSDRFREHYTEQADFIDQYNDAMTQWYNSLSAAFEGAEVKPGVTKKE